MQSNLILECSESSRGQAAMRQRQAKSHDLNILGGIEETGMQGHVGDVGVFNPQKVKAFLPVHSPVATQLLMVS